MSDADQNVLVELDALLDTRIPSLARCNPDAAALMMKPAYWKRLSDDFEKYTEGMVTNEAFREMYAKRDKDTLLGALATNMCLILTTLFDELGDQQVNSPHVGDLILTVNFWPYVLTPEETEAYLTNISVFVNNRAKMQAVWYRPEEITPTMLNTEYSAYILYDYNYWLGVQAKNFEKVSAPTVTVFAPAMSFVRDFTEADITVEGYGVVSPFELVEGSAKLFVDMHLLDLRFFCPVN